MRIEKKYYLELSDVIKIDRAKKEKFGTTYRLLEQLNMSRYEYNLRISNAKDISLDEIKELETLLDIKLLEENWLYSGKKLKVLCLFITLYFLLVC